MRGHPLGVLILATLVSLSTGCIMSQVQFVASSDDVQLPGDEPSASDDGVLGHVYASCWGIYLLARLPCVAGGIDEDGQPVWRYFKDVVEVQTVVDLLRAEALRRGATHLVDLESHWISEWSAVSLVFWVVETEASANAIRVTGAPPVGAIPLNAPSGWDFAEKEVSRPDFAASEAWASR